MLQTVPFPPFQALFISCGTLTWLQKLLAKPMMKNLYPNSLFSRVKTDPTQELSKEKNTLDPWFTGSLMVRPHFTIH
ncbi:uncharacterized protein BYT42DRAFT_586600 [Radiomyces spectabilis]|uniref:uncharacterized protein n=1 Tax=Radiomyces spectabilis TaxID=64574 RepID=UPI0022203C79|nr:uncharacterized protein BYT42DRAFT_586600 [Radiomyces spectabilis]KAI8367529.1 hypothetical protein BYT42DRAFT_586600 [Radiomyces spectabilis]